MFADGPVIFDKGRNVEAAWKFVEWLMTSEAQMSLADITGRVPAHMNAVHYWAEMAAPYIGGKERAHLWSDAASKARLQPFGVHYNDMMAVLNTAIYAALDGKKPARTALEEVAGRVQQILDQYFGGK